MNSLFRINDELTLFTENTECLVFSERDQTLSTLSPLHSFILIGISQGLDFGQLSNDYSDTGAEDLGLFREAFDQVASYLDRHQSEKHYSDADYKELTLSQHKVSASKAPLSLLLKVSGNQYAVSFHHDELYQSARHLLAPIVQAQSQSAIYLEVLESSGHYRIESQGHVMENNLRQNEVIPVLIDRLQVLSYQQHAYDFCFHGAALHSDGTDFLLPGESGAGKSTLCATLAAMSFDVYSDEMIAIDNPSGIRPIELPMAIKAGAWPLLAKHYPEITSAETFKRIDGRELKYIWPKTPVRNTKNAVRQVILFPRYSETEGFSTSALSPISALIKLVNGGYQVNQQLTVTKVEFLLNYLSDATIVDCTYDSSEQVIRFIEGL